MTRTTTLVSLMLDGAAHELRAREGVNAPARASGTLKKTSMHKDKERIFEQKFVCSLNCRD